MSRKKLELTGSVIQFSENSVTLLRKISETLNAQVFLTDQNTIVKYIDVSSRAGREYYTREIPVYQIMSPHPNLANYIDHVVIENRAFLHIEYYIKGDYNYIMAMNRISYSDIREAIIDVCMALDDLHNKSIIHMDLRPENILLSNEGISKLCDFGSSLRSELVQQLQQSLTLGTFIDTHTAIRIRPPELSGVLAPTIGPFTDMWQVGCLLYTMIFYESPFPYGFVENKDLSNCPKIFKNALEALLQVQYSKRPSAREVIEMLIPSPLLGGALAETRVTFIEKLVARSTKQLVNKVLSEDNYTMTQAIERIVYKGLKKPFKIQKFIQIIEERNGDNMMQTVKILHLMHIYMYKVPILLERFEEKLRGILVGFIFVWNLKSADKQPTPTSKYFACFIKQYSRLLLKKIDLFLKHEMPCNWGHFNISFASIDDILSYLEFCIYLVLGLSLETITELKSLRMEIIKTINTEISIIILILTKSLRSNGELFSVWYLKFKKLYRQIMLFSEKKNYPIFLASLPDETHLKHYNYNLNSAVPSQHHSEI